MENLDESNNKNVSLSALADYGGSDTESEDTEAPSIENMMNDESEESLEMSKMVLKNNMINACAHGPLSGNSRDEDTTRHMIIDSAESGVVEYEVSYRNVDTSDSESSSSSDSSDSDVDSVKDVEELSSSDENEAGTTGKLEPPKVKGELDLNDLPPIEDLAISLPAEETTKIGTITSIVDKLVIVRALPNTPAVDLDSVLFLDSGAVALGKVFDVFGPVSEPHYCVRFNSSSHVLSRGATAGKDVYIAPRTQHTNYVFLTQLMKMKGSDASWLHDVEPPPSQLEFSDDEEERRAKKQNKQPRGDSGANAGREGGVPPAPRGPPRTRPQRPCDANSRFGSGPSRARNPFGPSRRPPPPCETQYARPPPGFPPFPPPFNPAAPPPPLPFHFGGAPRLNPYLWHGDPPPPPPPGT